MHVIGILAVLSLHATLGRGSYDAWDLRLFDGSWYFGWSRDIARHFRFPSWENAPLYCVYYAIFHVLLKSTFAIYFAHRAVMLVVINLLGYLLFSRLFTPALAVAGVAYLQLLIEDGNIATYAVRPFVLIPFLSAAWFATRAGRWSGFWALLCLLWAAGCRPEWWVCLPVATLGLSVLQLQHARATHEPAWKLPAWLMIALGTVASSCAAIATSASPRSWLAFGQHYGYGYVRRHPSPDATDPGLYWQTYLRASFGDADSVASALLHNPRELLAHVLQNVAYFADELEWALRPKFLLSPWLDVMLRALNMLWLVAVLFALGALGLRLRAVVDFRRRMHEHARLLVVMLAATVAITVSALVVIPQAVYMYALAAALLLCGLAALQVWVGPWLARHSLAPLLALLIVSTFTIAVCPTPYDRPVPRIVYPAVQALPRIAGTAGYGLIADSALSFCIYADDPRCNGQEVLWMVPQPSDPAGFIQSTNTRVLLVSKRLRERLSPAWSRYVEAIIAAPEASGWRKVAPEPGKEAAIAIYERL
jgi:hypothetical protein